MLTFEVPLHRLRSGSRVVFAQRRPPAPGPIKRPGSLQKNLTLGHRIVRAVESGEARDFMEAAHRMGVSDAWVSMLVSLTFLAPDIQEEALIPTEGVPKIQFGQALWVSREPVWERQRDLLAELRARNDQEPPSRSP